MTPVESSPAHYDAAQDAYSPVVVTVTNPPIAAPATDGRIHLAYELLLVNASASPVTIESVESSADGGTLQSLTGEELTAVYRGVGTGDASGTLPGGGSAMIWMDAIVVSAAEVPTTIEHTVTVRMPEANPPIYDSVIVEHVPAVMVSVSIPVTIGPPLQGAGWLNGNGCCTLTPHRGAVSPINAGFKVPERWAIDYVQLTEDDRLFTGDKTVAQNYPAFGNAIIAVADGPVVAMTTDRPEQTPGANPTGLTLDEYGGNYIVQDIGDGRFAFYAHLQPGNPEHVEVGQQLKKGEPIALLGNSGNSDAPHLHFHIMDSPSPLASNGLPFLIDSFTLDGVVPSAEAIEAGFAGTPYNLDTALSGNRTSEAPLVGDVMTYAP
ncbi:M23 family metallopeptidase [Microbacterium luteolum]|uniref:M23 family metallopeptidase n=1 Tax=Microbacterium luteolum TaxID=69367 RepID=A0ABY7XMD1_MICLT|nr:M23 family metallopeptidase [Microbacterium luteolum]WDM43290.1 M23 family metallopeptidase [Microbacterium luteolum]